MPASNIEIIVVVGGNPAPLKVNTHQSVEHLVKEAFKEAGEKNAKPEDWELKDGSGNIIGLAQTIAAAGIQAGATLYLNLIEGGGG
jgi:hypothetical protein